MRSAGPLIRELFDGHFLHHVADLDGIDDFLRIRIRHLAEVRQQLVEWMEEHEYAAISQMQGSMARRSVTRPEAFERNNYMRVLSSYALRPAGR